MISQIPKTKTIKAELREFNKQCNQRLRKFIAADLQLALMLQMVLVRDGDDLNHQLETFLIAGILNIPKRQEIAYTLLWHRLKGVEISLDVGHLDRFARLIICIYHEKHSLDKKLKELLNNCIDFVRLNGYNYKQIVSQYFEHGRFCEVPQTRKKIGDKTPKSLHFVRKRAVSQLFPKDTLIKIYIYILQDAYSYVQQNVRIRCLK